MKFDELLDKLTGTNDPLQPATRLRYTDLTSNAGKRELVTFYPDASRSFDDLFSMICMITREGSPYMPVFGGYLFHRRSGGTEIYFEDGFLTPPHKHNFVELVYVMEGMFHKKIEGKDYAFNKGEVLLINQDISHGEYMYQKNQAVVTLQLSNAFFDKSMNHRDMALAGTEAEAFLRRYILNGSRDYFFILFTPPPPPTHTHTHYRYPAFLSISWTNSRSPSRGAPILSWAVWNGCSACFPWSTGFLLNGMAGRPKKTASLKRSAFCWKTAMKMFRWQI
jgi:quercetin dioxygenase-like cupin family protein